MVLQQGRALEMAKFLARSLPQLTVVFRRTTRLFYSGIWRKINSFITFHPPAFLFRRI